MCWLGTQAAEIDRSRRKLATLLAQSTGQTVAEVEALLEHDHHMDAHQALALGAPHKTDETRVDGRGMGIGSDQIGLDEVGWDGTGWDGVEWDGMGCDGTG